ncbi:acyl-CoA dehydrogenase family protein [Nonomuraea jiangxiensis]|uniref:Acyl-CoA dehydrogenase, C-terminal domain n=1 Tax=Nonomuraea jiangxiensis TaxID=633440 RepID=A0A1G8RPY9_9ACTN|nr:acyl-CoA dehydrogenase family protein [Nonomuraea jiangxiensis]SDJ19006.1 Acyl-CoA dehydrogenase, C-terminal domain [Nonomuraea jiangxiensis]
MLARREDRTLHVAYSQLLHAAIDVGIAGGALEEALEFVRTKARPWFESGHDRAAGDPFVIQRAGELPVKVRAAEALLDRAAQAVDTARDDRTDETAAAASIAVAAAKAFADPVAVEPGNASWAAPGPAWTGLNLHRHWRNACTHTLHDPARWKIQHIGRYVLNGRLPPRHGLL